MTPPMVFLAAFLVMSPSLSGEPSAFLEDDACLAGDTACSAHWAQLRATKHLDLAEEERLRNMKKKAAMNSSMNQRELLEDSAEESADLANTLSDNSSIHITASDNGFDIVQLGDDIRRRRHDRRRHKNEEQVCYNWFGGYDKADLQKCEGVGLTDLDDKYWRCVPIYSGPMDSRRRRGNRRRGSPDKPPFGDGYQNGQSDTSFDQTLINGKKRCEHYASVNATQKDLGWIVPCAQPDTGNAWDTIAGKDIKITVDMFQLKLVAQGTVLAVRHLGVMKGNTGMNMYKGIGGMFADIGMTVADWADEYINQYSYSKPSDKCPEMPKMTWIEGPLQLNSKTNLAAKGETCPFCMGSPASGKKVDHQWRCDLQIHLGGDYVEASC